MVAAEHEAHIVVDSSVKQRDLVVSDLQGHAVRPLQLPPVRGDHIRSRGTHTELAHIIEYRALTAAGSCCSVAAPGPDTTPGHRCADMLAQPGSSVWPVVRCSTRFDSAGCSVANLRQLMGLLGRHRDGCTQCMGSLRHTEMHLIPISSP